ncbi:BOLA class I histocompatibility antigen, alpha chain BL3-7-like [Platichthys flesus]|uniref:BOLA class I histocompatibility antigen, alpha chain BL3-7-like n=1 Tax=Platichthys flesus TaxID=8260 RepID=UPI002DBD5EE1|nr:BOLA class I histocompatibility antigen, alpha chain BL3-7-like [Platichthys flesus]
METKMKPRPALPFISLLSLLALFPAGLAEKHSLTYIYTAFSNPTTLPGIHEFTAMGLVDNTMIDYFDSDLERKVPKQPWMQEKMDKNYWDKGTQSRKSKQTWFRVNIDILIERMRQNKNETHILQWMHGCESITENGEMKFLEGKDTYNYDGNDFLHFDDKNGVWVSSTPAAKDTKRKWDGVQTLKDYTKGYLEKECLSWLNQFVEYGLKQQRAAPPPEMFMFAKKSHTDSNVILTCLASGFLQKDAKLQMKRKGCVLNEVDGVESSKVRPNNDDTYQARQRVEILKTDESEYTCEIIHEGSGLNTKITWDHKLPAEDSGLVIIAVVVVVVLLLIIGLIVGGTIFFLRKKGKFGSLSSGSTSSGSSDQVASQPAPSKPSAQENVPLTAKEDGSLSSKSDSGVSSDGGRTGESKNPSENEVLLDP